MHPKVKEFINQMEFELKANLHQGNWEYYLDEKTIINELIYHQAKLMMALRKGTLEEVKEHIADCGNFLLFLGNSKGLYNI